VIRKTLLTLGAISLAGCVNVTEPSIQTGPDAEVVGSNLHRVDHSRADRAYVDPAADFSKYTAIMVDPLSVDHVEIIQPSQGNSMRGRNSNWQLTDKNKAAMQAAFAEAMGEVLAGRGDYPIVTGAADNVLRITAVLTALAPTAPQDTAAARGAGRSYVFTEGAGTIFITIGFSDSESGEVLALIKDRHTGNNSTWGLNNSVTNMAEVRRAFSSWARAIKSRLDSVNGR